MTFDLGLPKSNQTVYQHIQIFVPNITKFPRGVLELLRSQDVRFQ